MTQADVRSRLDRAVRKLLDNDECLIELDVNERTITHKLAEYLQGEFPDWNVDCEYNRDGHKCKSLPLPPKKNVSCADTTAQTVFPDIIVHKRKTNDNNLLVLEAKKTGGSPTWDYRKLEAFKSELGYQHAVFVRLNKGRGSRQNPQVETEWR
jgi:hypothetical protein